MIYFLIFILLLFLVYFYDYRKTKSHKVFWLLLVGIILIFLGGLRYRVGFDSLVYERFFDKLKPLNLLTYKELINYRYAPGFVILASFTKLFTNEPVLFYFIQSGFVCCAVIRFFSKNSSHTFFGILLFYCFLFTTLVFEQIREGIAVGFFLFSWPYFKSNKWLQYYALVTCATFFHTSALILYVLPLILLPGIKEIFIFGKRTWVFFMIVFVIAFVLKGIFSKYIYLLALTHSMEELTAKYENTQYVVGNLNIFGFISTIIRYILYACFALVFFSKIKKSPKFEKSLLREEALVILSIYITILSVGVPIISRYNNYFFFFPMLLISNWAFEYLIFNHRKIRLGFVSWVILLLPLLTVHLYSYYGRKVNHSGTVKAYMAYYPYTSSLDKEKNGERMRVIGKLHKR